MPEPIDHRQLYRLPWSLPDNPIAWLEPTQACNLACDGCYRKNVKEHKTLDEVQADLDVFERLRNYDGVSVAGGDPLLHPDIVEITRRIKAMGHKTIINTNGLALTRELLLELKRAGLDGFTFHVDSRQGRPGWRDTTEGKLNELRSEYADMVASVGGIACAFNSTVYEETLDQVCDVAEWTARNIDRVQTVVFIAYRAARLDDCDYFAGGQKVDMEPIVYTLENPRRTDITAREVAATLQQRWPDFMPCAYLNGTDQADTFKWLMALRLGTRDQVFGYVGPKFMELEQAAYHLWHGRYMSYSAPSVLAVGRTAMIAGLWDPGVRASALAYAKAMAASPMDLLKTVHLQAVLMIQPIDILDNGRQNMCDGCPDMTVHNGKLVWSCRLEEPKNYGCFLTTVKHGGCRPGQY